MSANSQTIDIEVEISRSKAGTRGRKKCAGNGPSTCVPRISRLMALAIKFQGMIECGEVRDYADLARLGFVTRARMTQIMNLLLLAPDIQEKILDLKATTDHMKTTERQIRVVARVALWDDQRRVWRQAESPR